MKINLEHPFKEQWKFGYLVTNKENRKNIILYNTVKNRTTISYARYLMCVKLGYILSEEYEVDHIDNDKTNDDINNLQVLTKQQNIQKQQDYIKEFTKKKHGTLSCYRYCKCEICKTGKQLYNKKLFEEYRLFVNAVNKLYSGWEA